MRCLMLNLWHIMLLFKTWSRWGCVFSTIFNMFIHLILQRDGHLSCSLTPQWVITKRKHPLPSLFQHSSVSFYMHSCYNSVAEWIGPPQCVTVWSANSYWFCLYSHKGRLSGISLGHEGRNLRSTLPKQRVRHCFCSHDPQLRSILGKNRMCKKGFGLVCEVHAAAPVTSSHSRCHLPVATLFVARSACLIHTRKQSWAACELSTYCT